MVNPQPHPLNQSTSLFEVLLLTGIVTALTIGAASVYPIWDDRRLLLLLEANGLQAVDASFGIRPLVASLFTFLIRHELLSPVSLVLHWLGWLGIGLVTMQLWKLMFPQHANLALLPALLSVAPVLCKVQLVVFTVVFIGLSPTLLGYIGILLLMADPPARERKVALAVGGIGLTALATVISEYGTLTAIVGVTLLMAKGMRGGKRQRKRAFIAAGLLALTTLLFYLIFLGFGSRATPGFLPSYSLQFMSWKIGIIPFRLLSGVWRGLLGGVFESLGSITLNSKAAALSFLCGAAMSLLVVLVVRKRYNAPRELRHDAFSVMTLLAATVIVLIPILLMDRTLDSRWDSRFYLPLLPVVSSLTVFTLLSVVRRRFWIVVAIVCGFLAGYWTVTEIAWMMRNRDTVRNERLDHAPAILSSITAKNNILQ